MPSVVTPSVVTPSAVTSSVVTSSAVTPNAVASVYNCRGGPRSRVVRKLFFEGWHEKKKMLPLNYKKMEILVFPNLISCHYVIKSFFCVGLEHQRRPDINHLNKSCNYFSRIEAKSKIGVYLKRWNF